MKLVHTITSLRWAGLLSLAFLVTNLAKAQILAQASTSMLAQANQSQQGVLKLLQ